MALKIFLDRVDDQGPRKRPPKMVAHNHRLDIENFRERSGKPELFCVIDNIHRKVYFLTKNENTE